MKCPSYGHTIMGVVRAMNDEITEILQEENGGTMNHVVQAKDLQRRVQKALAAINARDKEGLTEIEVLFRLNAVEGMLIMANNDIGRMVRRWEEEVS